MSDMQISQVLAQIRSLSAQTSATRTAVQPAVGGSAGDGFGQMLKQGIDAVNKGQMNASALADAYERGTPGVDLAKVMIETQKASIQFRALAETRNRLVSAYQDIMNMPI
jgi:flagellar hook-basal body complex protein FliE